MARLRPPIDLRMCALACAFALAAGAALAADVLPDRNCADGVCMANVDPAQAVEPCRDASIVIAWAQAGGAMAIECDLGDGPMEQPLLVFDRRAPHRPAYTLTGIRAFVPEALPQIAGAQREDGGALLPACQPPKPPRMAPGELLLTQKAPSPWHSDRTPACLRILRVASTPAGIEIRADDGDSPRPVKDAPDWSALAAKMSALAAQADAQVRAHVARARARLRDAPDPKSAPRGWLARGDAVVVLERAAGAVKVLHAGRDGKAAEHWLAPGDIALDAAR
jgi:hypothetical protein